MPRQARDAVGIGRQLVLVPTVKAKGTFVVVSVACAVAAAALAMTAAATNAVSPRSESSHDVFLMSALLTPVSGAGRLPRFVWCRPLFSETSGNAGDVWEADEQSEANLWHCSHDGPTQESSCRPVQRRTRRSNASAISRSPASPGRQWRMAHGARRAPAGEPVYARHRRRQCRHLGEPGYSATTTARSRGWITTSSAFPACAG